MDPTYHSLLTNGRSSSLSLPSLTNGKTQRTKSEPFGLALDKKRPPSSFLHGGPKLSDGELVKSNSSHNLGGLQRPRLRSSTYAGRPSQDDMKQDLLNLNLNLRKPSSTSFSTDSSPNGRLSSGSLKEHSPPHASHLNNGKLESSNHVPTSTHSVPNSTPKMSRSHSLTPIQRSLSQRFQLPGLPVLPPSKQSEPPSNGSNSSDGYFSYWEEKKLHIRRWFIVSNVHRDGEKEPCARCLAKGLIPNGKKCIRVGGGFIIFDENGQFYLGSSANKLKVLKRLADGTLLLEDGSMILPDGTRVLPDGTRIPPGEGTLPEGYYIDENGNLVFDPSRVGKKNQNGRSSSSRGSADDKGRNGSLDSNQDGGPQGGLGVDSATRGGPGGGQHGFGQDGESSNLRGGEDGSDLSGRSKGGKNGREGENGSDDDSNGPGSKDKSGKLKPGDVDPQWGQEVVDVLPDGTRILKDGTRILPDGTVILPDGTRLSPEAAQDLLTKRKKRKEAGGTDRMLKRRPGESDEEYKARLRAAGYSDSEIGAAMAFTDNDDPSRRRKRSAMPSMDNSRLGGRDEDGSVAYLGKGKHSLALDYLAKYCIMGMDQLSGYKEVFDQLDLNGDGWLSQKEMEIGIKSVNKHMISGQECRYVQDILEVAKEPRLTFRMFAVICALSERVMGLDSMMKNLLNGLNLEALVTKLEKCKNLFYLLDEKKEGIVEMDLLMDELHAGRISLDHEEIIISKFQDQGKSFMDFMDFLTYCPLFVQIHDTITADPLKTERDL